MNPVPTSEKDCQLVKLNLLRFYFVKFKDSYLKQNKQIVKKLLGCYDSQYSNMRLSRIQDVYSKKMGQKVKVNAIRLKKSTLEHRQIQNMVCQENRLYFSICENTGSEKRDWPFLTTGQVVLILHQCCGMSVFP